VSGVVLAVFMKVPLFDPNTYPTGGALRAPSGGLFGDILPTDQGGGFGMQGRSSSQGGGAMQGMSRGSQGGGASHAGGGSPPLLMRRYSFATGYIALGLLALTLLIGPANLLLGRRTPVSSYLRRDVGICSAIASVVHVVFGFLVKHGGGAVLDYFFASDGGLLDNTFGLANYTGLAALMIVAALAVISSNAALRKLKPRNWKRIQRLNYALFALATAHGVGYGALWRTTSPYTRLLFLLTAVVVVAQLAGTWLYRQRSGRAAGLRA
jgi:methionine sulfoxide reductase heme-binding subunit